MNPTLHPPLARYLVLGPTLFLSLALSGFGVPPLWRLAICVAFGAVLIVGVARYQRRRVS